MTADKRQRKFPNLRAGAATGKQSVKYPSSRTAGLKRGGSRGRKRGIPNKATKEAKELAERILDDPQVQQRMLDDARRGRLAPPVLTMLMGYRWGKPKETVKLEGQIEHLHFLITDDIPDDDAPPPPVDPES